MRYRKYKAFKCELRASLSIATWYIVADSIEVAMSVAESSKNTHSVIDYYFESDNLIVVPMQLPKNTYVIKRGVWYEKVRQKNKSRYKS